MHNALIVSPRTGWAARSGLADMLSWLSLAAHEVAGLDAAPDDTSGYALAIVRVAPGGAAPDAAQWGHAGLSDAIKLAAGRARPAAGIIDGHLPEPVTEAALAAALAAAGFLLPLPGECPAIGQHISGLVDGDAAVAAELVASLLATNQADLQAFQQACAGQRWDDAQAAVHRIKATAHMVGTASLGRLSQRIEILAGQGRGDTVRALAGIYVPAVQRVSEVLAALAG